MTLRLPALPRFTTAELIFSAKAFASAMLAMYIASRAGLPRPFWAMMTTYIVAHPLAGAVRSKALFRFGGTLVGSLATLLLVPALSNAPELLTFALGLWVAVCLYVSLLDRTPRSYVFMLSGYTAALIGFPSVETPLALFDTAVARVEEIGLGILCATLVHSLVLPQGLAPSVLGMLDRALRDARRWTGDLLQLGSRTGAAPAAPDARTLQADRQRLAGDLTQLRLLSTHIPFDTSHLRWTAGAVRAMQDRVAGLTPALSAVEDRLRALAAAAGDGALPADVAAVLVRADAWLQAVPTAQGDGDLPALRTAIRALADAPAPAWSQALRVALAQRLEELVDGWHGCARLRREIDEGLGGASLPRRVSALGGRALHRDHGLAALSGLAALLTICLCGAIWILTGWPSGSVACMMAAVFCSLFANLDDPVPAIKGFLKFTLLSMPVSALYVLVLLPNVQDFGLFAAVCAPAFLVLGCFIARPTTYGAALAMTLGVASSLALHDTSNADIVGFVNSNIGQTIGVLMAARVTGLVRSVGAAWAARRIQRATWRELADMAGAPRLSAAAQGYAVRMLDRIGLLAPRIAQAGGSVDGVQAEDTLRDLRMGADIVALQRVRGTLPMAPSAAVFDGIAGFFRGRAEGRTGAPPPSLLERIDRLLSSAMGTAAPLPADGRTAVAALVGLRRNLYPGAPALPAAPALMTPEGAAP